MPPHTAVCWLVGMEEQHITSRPVKTAKKLCFCVLSGRVLCLCVCGRAGVVSVCVEGHIIKCLYATCSERTCADRNARVGSRTHVKRCVLNCCRASVCLCVSGSVCALVHVCGIAATGGVPCSLSPNWKRTEPRCWRAPCAPQRPAIAAVGAAIRTTHTHGLVGLSCLAAVAH